MVDLHIHMKSKFLSCYNAKHICGVCKKWWQPWRAWHYVINWSTSDKYLHCIGCMRIVEHHRLLHGLVIIIEFFDVRREFWNFLFDAPQLVEVIFERTFLSEKRRLGIQSFFDPLTHHVCLHRELFSEMFVVLLPYELVVQPRIAFWNQLPAHHVPFIGYSLEIRSKHILIYSWIMFHVLQNTWLLFSFLSFSAKPCKS